MERRFLFLLSGLLAVSLTGWAQSAGGGISVFVPETLYAYGEGTIAFEQGLSTSIGLGPLLSVPVGFAYHSSDGYLLEHADLEDTQAPALYGDALIPYLMLQARLPLGPLYLEAFGGGALAWAFSLRPTGEFAATLASTDNREIAVTSLDIEKGMGYGWLAGAALGVQIDAVSVDLGVTYRVLRIPLDIDASYVEWDGTTGTPQEETFADAVAVLRGLSFRLGGSFSF